MDDEKKIFYTSVSNKDDTSAPLPFNTAEVCNINIKATTSAFIQDDYYDDNFFKNTW